MMVIYHGFIDISDIMMINDACFFFFSNGFLRIFLWLMIVNDD